MSSPLENLRVVVTRATQQNAPLRALLEERGAVVIEMPLIEIVEPVDGGRARDKELARLALFDWVVVTSPNGAARIAPFLHGAGLPKVAAVGRATARAIGGDVALIAEPALASALVAAFPEGAGSILLVQGQLADNSLGEALAAKGWNVTRVEGYRTVPCRPTADAVVAAGDADVVLFASGSAVSAWHATFGTKTPPIVAVMGPPTAERARELGLNLTTVADEQTLEGLVVAAERAVSAH